MNSIFYPVSALVNLVTSIIVASLVISRNYKSPLNRAFFYFASSVAFWSFFYFLWQLTRDKNLALLWCRWLMVGAIFIPSTFFHFSIELIEASSKYRKLVNISYLTSIIFLITNCTSLIVKDVVPRLVFSYWPVAGELYLPYLGFFIGVVLYSHILMFKFYKTSSGIKKNQIKYVFLGMAIGFLGGATNYPLWFNIQVLPVGNVLVSIYVFLVAFAIIKYRLMDIRVAISNVAIFIAIYAVVLGLPFYVYFLGYKLFSLIFAILLASAGPIIYSILRRQAENKILEEQRKYQNTLLEASKRLSSMKSEEEIADMIVKIIYAAMSLKNNAVYLREEKTFRLIKQMGEEGNFISEFPLNHAVITSVKNLGTYVVQELEHKVKYRFPEINEARKFFKDYPGSVVVPVSKDENPIAILILGEKLNNTLFSDSDLNVLNIISGNAALALVNAHFFDDIKRTQEQLFQAEKMATIGIMADGLSHQINNRFHALGFIAGDALDTIQLNKNLEMPEKLKKILADLEKAFARVQENVTQGGEIVRGLLKYTRKGEEGLSPVNVDEVVSSAYEMAQFKIKSYQMSLVRSYDKNTLPKVKGNSTQLQEVFFNLIDNAYDAMMQRKNEAKEEHYHPTLTIYAQAQTDTLEMIFEDNGMGVKDEDTQKLFTPFFTTKLSSKKGTGLGLYVIRKIIEDNHKGKVEFVSKYMVGTKMKISLPIAGQ